LYWNGRYHLFYQFWPPGVGADRTWSEAMHWGHAVSDDLVHWTDLPPALSPDDGPEDGCYSGQSLVEDDRVVLMYFGTGAGNCIATAEGPFLTDVRRHPNNPVIPLDEDAPYEVFDPCLWREDGTYYSLSGGVSDGRTAEFFFQSDDLADWEYLGTLIEDGFYTDPGEDGAVPNFFELDGSHVLLFFSHARGPQYYVGEYDPEALVRTPEVGPLALDDGEHLDLRVFVDRSVIEVFANGRQSLTTRVYPTRDDSVGVSVQARRGGARLESMDVWDMQSIWLPAAERESRWD